MVRQFMALRRRVQSLIGAGFSVKIEDGCRVRGWIRRIAFADDAGPLAEVVRVERFIVPTYLAA